MGVYIHPQRAQLTRLDAVHPAPPLCCPNRGIPTTWVSSHKTEESTWDSGSLGQNLLEAFAETSSASLEGCREAAFLPPPRSEGPGSMTERTAPDSTAGRVTQPTAESAWMGSGSRDEEASRGFDSEMVAFDGRRDAEGRRREKGCGKKTSAFHLSPPTSRTRRLWGRRGPCPWLGSLPLARSAHPKIILSLLLQLLRAQVRHGLAPLSVLAATSASLVGRSPPPAPPRPPSPWTRGLPRLPAGGGLGGAGRSHCGVRVLS